VLFLARVFDATTPFQEVNTTMTGLSFVQLVTQALMGAGHPLAVAEIKARVEMVRPVRRVPGGRVPREKVV